MGESLNERRRVQDEGLRVVNCGKLGRTQHFVFKLLENKVLGDRTSWKEAGNYVPAPAVIRRPQALSGFIGRKERVGGFVRFTLKPTA